MKRVKQLRTFWQRADKTKKGFIVFYLAAMVYALLIRAELYESSSNIVIKELGASATISTGLSLLGAGVSNQAQDSKILETYLTSFDVLDKLDQQFGMRDYYESDAMDVLNRLWSFSSREKFLDMYRNHVIFEYDDISGVIRLGFLHTNPEQARQIVEFLIKRAEDQLNIYSQRNALKQVDFLEKKVSENRAKLDASTQRVEDFQNKHILLDPTSDVTSASAIISNLEAMLVEKRTQLNQLRKYMSPDAFEIVNLESEIEELEKSLIKTRHKLTGGNNEKLNTILFDFERIKAEVTFDQEVYKESLVQLEVAKIDASKEAKTLMVLTQPNTPDGYVSPNRQKLFVTISFLVLLAYGILALVISIVRDHRD